jgi:hypothetical protein
MSVPPSSEKKVEFYVGHHFGIAKTRDRKVFCPCIKKVKDCRGDPPGRPYYFFSNSLASVLL